MRRTTVAIGVALALGASYSTSALAQEDEFEVTLDVVLDDIEDVDGVIMSVIEEEVERSELEEEFAEERELEARLREEEAFIDGERDGADEYDDGQFDEYDDGEEIETGEDDDAPFEEESIDEAIEELADEIIEEPVGEMIEEPGMDEPLVDEPGIDEPIVEATDIV